MCSYVRTQNSMYDTYIYVHTCISRDCLCNSYIFYHKLQLQVRSMYNHNIITHTHTRAAARQHNDPPFNMSRKNDTIHADERRFLDGRGSSGPLAPNGLNPATILEKAVTERIVDSYFWKEQCFGVNEADVVDRVVEHVRFIGGTYGVSQKPAPFLCLVLKLLQLAPHDNVLKLYLGYGGERFKYLRALAAMYVRLTRRAEDVHKLLEPLLEDRRKLRKRARGVMVLTYVDEFVDDLLVKDRVCATSLWKMSTRDMLEDLGVLEPRVSPLGDLDDILADEEEVDDKDEKMDDGEKGEEDENKHDSTETASPDDEMVNHDDHRPFAPPTKDDKHHHDGDQEAVDDTTSDKEHIEHKS